MNTPEEQNQALLKLVLFLAIKQDLKPEELAQAFGNEEVKEYAQQVYDVLGAKIKKDWEVAFSILTETP
jgi:hypothetical protein